MTDYAIIKTGGKQYRVREGDTVAVEKLDGEVGDRVRFDQVLMTSLDGSVQVGSPTVDNATVAAEITEHGRGEKLTVFKYKAKTRSRVKKGHRQPYTSLLIRDISIRQPRRTRSASKAESSDDAAPAAAGSRASSGRSGSRSGSSARSSGSRTSSSGSRSSSRSTRSSSSGSRSSSGGSRSSTGTRSRRSRSSGDSATKEE